MLSLLAVVAMAPGVEVTVTADGTAFARQGVPAQELRSTRAQSRTIYLNRNGGTVSPGANNCQAHTSSLVAQPIQLAGWQTTDAKWQATLTCLRNLWATYDVQITDVDPGAAPHIEAMVGDAPTTMGLPATIGGVSPLSYTCSVIENSIVFVFPANLKNDPQATCEAISHEVGHSYGLDHELEPADPMTYMPYAGKRTFQDKTAMCGETNPRPCGVEGHACRMEQNTASLLLTRLGAFGSDGDAPEVEITSPADHANVEPGFVVEAQASDNVAVASVTLYVDGEPVAMRSAPPYSIPTDVAIKPGNHMIGMEAADANGNTSMREIVVRIAGDAPTSDDEPPGGGCSTGRGGGLGLALALVALVRRRSTPSCA